MWPAELGGKPISLMSDHLQSNRRVDMSENEQWE